MLFGRHESLHPDRQLHHFAPLGEIDQNLAFGVQAFSHHNSGVQTLINPFREQLVRHAGSFEQFFEKRLYFRFGLNLSFSVCGRCCRVPGVERRFFLCFSRHDARHVPPLFDRWLF